jgi:ribosomal protein S18 acetylase RimI-like enzyme
MTHEQIALRPARCEDGPVLARLIDYAGEGLPRWVWEQAAAPDQSPLEYGAARAEREDGGFSYRNAWVVDVSHAVAGMLLGYRLDDPYEPGELAELPAPIRPIVELESCAPGSWYINALAILPDHRSEGLGTRLLHHACTLARTAGASELSLIVDDANAGARRLYARHGFVERARRDLVPFGGKAPGQAWLLLVRPLAS